MWLQSPRSEAQAHACLPVCGAPWWVILQHSIMLWLFFIVEYGITHFLCTMRVSDVWASSWFCSYLCAKFCFFGSLHWWLVQVNKIAYSINQSLTHSLNHSPNLFDAPGTELLALRNICTTVQQLCADAIFHRVIYKPYQGIVIYFFYFIPRWRHCSKYCRGAVTWFNGTLNTWLWLVHWSTSYLEWVSV